MCSLGDDNIEDNEASKYMPETHQFQLIDSKCNKCKTNTPNIVLRGKDAYCKVCFLAATIHKFKALLGKHRLIYPKDNVLVLHKGGHPSTALLHFLRTGLDLSTPKKLRFQPIFIYIDDNNVLTLDERKETIDNIRKEATKFNFIVYFISLKQYILNPDKINELLKDPTIFETATLNTVIHENCNTTNKADILKIYERQLLLDAAKVLDCKSVFTTELGIDIASQLLTNVSLGRGIHLPLDTGICDNRDSNVKIIRPLRLFEMKELAYYNYFNNLEPVTIKIAKENPYASVQNLMKTFVSNLQSNFPATITTIVRTGDKLAMDEFEGICDNRDSNVKIIRPLRLFEMKELAYYNYFNNLEPVTIKIAKENPYASVQNLMKTFVSNLQSNFPATITTIVRTGDKLAMDESLSKHEKCLLCKGPKENSLIELSSSESTSFSHWVSTQTPNYEISPEARYNHTLDSFNNSHKSKYCFACNRISNNLL